MSRVLVVGLDREQIKKAKANGYQVDLYDPDLPPVVDNTINLAHWRNGKHRLKDILWHKKAIISASNSPDLQAEHIITCFGKGVEVEVVDGR